MPHPLRTIGLPALLLAGCTAPALGPRPTTVVVVPAHPSVAIAVDPPETPARDEPEHGEQRVVVEWGRAKPTPGCFFFSGPEGLGRDTRLGVHARYKRSGASVRLEIDGGAVFTGTLSAGRVTLTRRASYWFESEWNVTETIEGELQGSILKARYGYEECDTAKGECPGECRIDAPLVVRLTPASGASSP